MMLRRLLLPALLLAGALACGDAPVTLTLKTSGFYHQPIQPPVQ